MSRALACLVLVAAASAAHAGPLTLTTDSQGSVDAAPYFNFSGTPEGGFSLSMGWSTSSTATPPITFNFAAWRVTETQLQNPAAHFNNDWTIIGQRDNVVVAGGEPTRSMIWNLHVTTPQSHTFYVDFIVFNEMDEIIIVERRWWDGAFPRDRTAIWFPTRAELLEMVAIPLPSPGLAALAGFGLIVSRRRRIA